MTARPPRQRQRAARLVERILLVVGIVCLSYYAYATVEAYLYQAYETRELAAILASGPAARAGDGEREPGSVRREPEPGSVIGRIDIPRLGVSTVVRAGSDARTLQLAVGHIPGTALPGEDGNIGLAGHRDTFFRKLKNIRSDDEIRLVTPEGTFVYAVERTDVVQPRDVWVLDPTERPVLTLVTCYPFSYIGSAPQRFIVRAALTPAATSVAAEPAD